jgi:hypothetical protein
MQISQQEANNSLEQVNRVIATTRTIAAYAGADLIFGVWGVAWTFAFAGSQVLENEDKCRWFALLWLVILAIAIPTTLLIAHHYRAPVQKPYGKRIGWLWFFVYAYAWTFAFLLHPFVDVKALDTLYAQKCITALNCLIPMFVYIVMGLWLHENYFIVFAVFISIITIFGLIFFSGIFWIWMAVFGGASFLSMAVYMRLCWSSALRKEQRSSANHG